MAALSGEKTLAELSAEFGVHPTMISDWKQELVKRAGELFARGNKAPAVGDEQKVIDNLHRKIGQLLLRATASSAHCRLTDSPASGAIIARLAAIGRWRAARQENRTRPASIRSSGADRRSPSAHPRPPAPCCRAQTAPPHASPAPASSC